MFVSLAYNATGEQAMKVAIPRESVSGERRVAMVPQTVRQLTKRGWEICVENAAGTQALLSDQEYQDAGASIVHDEAALWAEAQCVVKIHPPSDEQQEMQLLRSGSILICQLWPRTNLDMVRRLAEAGVTSLALDMLPRITRSQSMDVLSSQSTVAGYRAVLIAAGLLPRMAPMLMTAAGTIKPANALIIGAGVAGLQAIATAKRLGAVVTAIDVRPAVGEQVESLGAKFIAMEVDHGAEDSGGYATDLGHEFYRKEQEIVAPHLRHADIVITTALIPGRKAPLLITEEMIRTMRPGAVIVDLAGQAGGNCEISKAGQTITYEHVTVVTPLNLPAEIPADASSMYSHNVASFLQEITDEEGNLRLDRDNEIVQGTLITHDGQVVHPEILKMMDTAKG